MNSEVFEYLDFAVGDERQTAYFRYAIEHAGNTYQLTETLRFPVPLKDSIQQQAALRALHIALGISYYKIYLSAVIRHPYDMDETEANFWNEVWLGGLGELLYINQLSAERLAKFKPQTGKLLRDPTAQINSKKALLGIGGGKDSIVAGEFLKELGLDLTGFVLATGEHQGQASDVAQTMQVPLLAVERTMDAQYAELRKQPNTYRGHIPISLIFGLVGVNLAIANDVPYVVVANEASASLPQATWEDRPVNHQWSKSFTFEQLFQRFVKDYIHTDVTYFSAIRPLTSVAVARKFATLSQYFEVFTSDNSVFRIKAEARPPTRWSMESPKSLSSFMLLSPWLNETDMIRIFGRDFLNEPSLEPLFKQLTGQEGHPPLDCVGTVDELVLSINLASLQGKYTNSYLMKQAVSSGVINQAQDWQSRLNAALALQPEHAFPIALEPMLKEKLR